jgi:signal transduction histidine kinase
MTLTDNAFNIENVRMSYEADAIEEQLSLFQNSQEFLDNLDGLLYYIITPEIRHDEQSFSISSNVNETMHSTTFFKSQPVYYLISGDPTTGWRSGEASHPFDRGYHSFRWHGAPQNKSEVFLAFTHDFVINQNSIYSGVRDAYILDLSIIAISVILILGLTILLLVGVNKGISVAAGEAKQKCKVHFSPIDKPYLDISLAVVACWIAFVVVCTFISVERIWHYGNLNAVNILFASAVLLAVPFILLWLMSLAKRVKAGSFWKHTMIYKIFYNMLYGFLRFCVRTVKSLWAGLKLTFKVGVISFGSFCIMLFVAMAGFSHNGGMVFLLLITFTAAVAILLLLYARRIRNLEQGTRLIREGKYDTPINAGGGELGSIADSINNISAGINKAVEERMKSERLKTELITNVSHDIRTPLTSIITYTDLLGHEGLDCEKAPEYLDILKQKSLRLKTLTDELFEAAKAATGNIEVNLVELNIVSLINQVLGELDSTIKSSGLDLRVSLPEKLIVRADGRLMQRIIENLLSNVFKYSLPGSRVYLDTHSANDSYICINIKNISANELNFDPSELTERFKRGDDARTDGGSGLGLSIVQSFTAAQGGKFEISIDGDLFKATVLLPNR